MVCVFPSSAMSELLCFLVSGIRQFSFTNMRSFIICVLTEKPALPFLCRLADSLTKVSTKQLHGLRFFLLYFMRTWLFFFKILLGIKQNFVLCRLPKLRSLGSITRQDDVYSW